MPEGALLDAPEELTEDVVAEEPQEIPSVFSVTNRYLVGRAEVSPPAEDGSRVMRLYSANAGVVVEANLAPQLCEFVSAKLIEVEVIEEDEDGDA